MNNIFENINLFFKQINAKTEHKIARTLLKKTMRISVAESCTGGLISSRLTDIAGSSAYVKENYVTYSNEAKTKLLGVSPEVLEKFGAVSEECAIEMVKGLFEKTECDIALITTGIAGPGGASGNKKVGLLYVAVKNAHKLEVKRFNINPQLGRKSMKFMFSQMALEFLLEFLKKTDEKIAVQNQDA